MNVRMAGLADTRVLLTGGTSGLGRAMAEALVKAGARVALTGRDRSRADTIAEQLGLSATGLELDVRDEASVQSGVEEAYARLGGVDVLPGFRVSRWLARTLFAYRPRSCTSSRNRARRSPRPGSGTRGSSGAWGVDRPQDERSLTACPSP